MQYLNIFSDSTIEALKKELPTLQLVDEDGQEGLYEFLFKGKTIQVTNWLVEQLTVSEVANLLRPFVVANGKTACKATESVKVLCHMHVPEQLSYKYSQMGLELEGQRVLAEQLKAKEHLERARSLATECNTEKPVEYAPISVKRALALSEQLPKVEREIQVIELDQSDFETVYRLVPETGKIEVVLGSKTISELIGGEVVQNIESELTAAREALVDKDNEHWAEGLHLGNVHSWNIVHFDVSELDRYIAKDGPDPLAP
ncbi:hypothetical protein [Vibrio owensii]|uniref:hypothetical protein n=1 Tax=Vibrio owensii TaxID=696485 RepID=UPI003CC5DDA2